MFEIPEAWPTWSCGTAEVDADDAGPLESPSPAAIATSGSTNTAYFHDESTKARTAKPTAATPKPIRIARPVPILTAIGVISGVIAIIAAAAGRVASPACRALIPNAAGFWKYRLSTYIRPLIVPATMRIASVAPTRIALRSSFRSTIGAVTRFSTTTNSHAATTEITRQPIVASDVQPQLAPSLSASTSGTRIPAISTVPVQSIDFDRFGSLDS